MAVTMNVRPLSSDQSKVKETSTSGKKDTSGIKSGQVKYSPQVDDGTYKAQEYFTHNEWSFLDYMVDMNRYRLKQPSNKK